MNRIESSPEAIKILNETKILNDDATIGGLQGLQFISVDSYTTFLAEYAFEDNDIIFHFFLPMDLAPQARAPATIRYWTELFPQVLEPVVFDVFKAQPPRVQAAYVNDCDLNSWWLRAYGFGALLEREALCSTLFDALDVALDEALKKT